MDRITIATLNIAAASKERARRVLDEWLDRSSFDVYVLTETSDGDGTKLIMSEFNRAGWAVFQRTTVPGDRGSIIVSRIKATEATTYAVDDPAPGRSIIIDLHTTPRVRLIGMYVPNRGNDPSKSDRKRAFLNSWIRCLLNDRQPDVQRVLLGDLNVVPTSQRPKFLPQERFEYNWYDNIAHQIGLYDAAIKHGASGHESTWVAYTGEGYTYDHIFPEKSLIGRVVQFKYDHSTRVVGGVSDHSALILSLDLDSVDYIHRHRVLEPRQTELFKS